MSSCTDGGETIGKPVGKANVTCGSHLIFVLGFNTDTAVPCCLWLSLVCCIVLEFPMTDGNGERRLVMVDSWSL